MAFRLFILTNVWTILFIPVLFAQGDCIEAYGGVYGSPDANERGTCLVATVGNDAMFVLGIKDDSTLLLKVDLAGEILWSRTFDIIPGTEEYPTAIIRDSEGMLAIHGIAGDPSGGGNIFAFRYNPDNHQVLWANEYTSSLFSYTGNIIQKGSGGNYVITNNPHHGNTDDNEVLEINKNTGIVIPTFSKNYLLGSSSEAFSEMIYDGNFIYGCGRYTDGFSTAQMRHTLVKLNPTDGSQVWVKMGHIPSNLTARLYGANLLIDQNEIISTYVGDPSGTSTTNTKLYIQRTTLDGSLVWLKQYELPGNNDFPYALVQSDGGYVILAGKGAPSGKLMMFKINPDGSLVWGRSYQFSSIISSANTSRGVTKLIEVGGMLVFTAAGVNPSGTTDMLIVRTDLEGMAMNPCMTTQTISIPVVNVNNPSFYTVNPTIFTVNPTVNSESPESLITEILPREECIITDTLYTFIQAAICEGNEYEGYTEAGTYVDNFTSVQGCDSIRTLDLDVNDPITTIEHIEICLGETYAGYNETGIYIDTFQNFLGCDSIHTINLDVVALQVFLNVQICDGETYEGYSVSGIYVDTIQSIINSCDTVRNLDLNVQPVQQTFISALICEGEEYEGYTDSGVYIDIFQNVEGCDSMRTLDLIVAVDNFTEEDVTICLGESYNGYVESGIYLDTFQNSFGCDSFHTLTLEVEAFEIDISASICEGEEYGGYSNTGFYTDTLQGEFNSCDTIRFLDLTVYQIHETFVIASICSGNHYEGYTVTGEYVDDFVNIYGCDSVRTLDLTVADEIFTNFEIEICSGQSYEGYFVDGTYVDEFTTAGGCDSIRTLNLIVTDEIHTSESKEICPGDIYQGYMDAGIYLDTFSSIAGCDSIRTLNLSLAMPEISLEVLICYGGQFENYTDAGLYVDTLQGNSGECDTLRYLDLLVNPPLQTFINASICNGQTLLGYSVTGFYADTFQTFEGCDSVRSLNLTVSDVIQHELQIEICPGQSYEGYIDEGVYLDTFTSFFGCDSIRTLNLLVELPSSFPVVSICSGSEFDGYTIPGMYVDTIHGAFNTCDTVRHLLLNVTPALETFIVRSICSGDSFLGYSVSGIYADTFTSIQGCDSIRILNLTVVDQIETDEIVQICDGESYNGYSIEGIYTDTLQAAMGCDSIATLHLSVVAIEKTLDVHICSGNTFENYATSGFYVDTIPGIGDPCDTIRYLILTVQPAVITTIEKMICEGEDYDGYTATGVYTDTLKTPHGCDSVRTIMLTSIDEVFSHYTTSVCEGISFGHSTPGVHVDTLISYAGCDSIRTLIVNGGATYIPNVFSPNNDGINDLFTVFQYPENTLDLQYFAIFDRFGDMTYETEKWPVAWNGNRLDGQPYQPAVFAYVLIYKCGEKRIIERGDITLIR